MASPAVANVSTIGIDLGTTASCVGIYRNGVELIKGKDSGQRTTPSYVSFPNETEKVIGAGAKSLAESEPQSTVFDAKRLIGRKFDDPTVASDLKNWPFSVIRDPATNLPKIQVAFKSGAKQSYSPQEISAMVLSNLKEAAEDYLGHAVSNAVITVPAHFNNSQKLATKEAGRLAGLNVVRIINEPTAAAMAYGLDKRFEGSDMHGVLVYDLGGGTLDVSILCISKGKVEVKATAGDTHLGGMDFDHKLVVHFVSLFKESNGLDLNNNASALRKLRTAAENARKDLSKSTETDISIDNLVGNIPFHTKLTREEFENICDSLFRRSFAPVEQALRVMNMDKSCIEEIILVGGCTRMPRVSSMLSDYFEGKPINSLINPDEAVAYGATVCAAALDPKTESLSLMSMKEITPRAINLSSGEQSTVIEPGTVLPTQRTQTIDASKESHNVSIQITEGGRQDLEPADIVADVEISDIRTPHITVTYDIDEDGLVSVSALNEGEADHPKITIRNTPRPPSRPTTPPQ